MKLTETQKKRLKNLRAFMAKEKKYVPRGQGDGMNQGLRIDHIGRDIKKTKVDPEFRSQYLWNCI